MEGWCKEMSFRGFSIVRISAILLMFLVFGGTVVGSDVMDVGYGARSISLGRTYVGQRGDMYGVFGNPGSLSGVDRVGLVSMYGQMEGDVSYGMLGFVHSSKYGRVFVGQGISVMGGFVSTFIDPVSGRVSGGSVFSYRESVLLGGYQNELSGKVSYGFRMKYINKVVEGVNGYSGRGINGDVGILLLVNDRLNIGMVLRNVVSGASGGISFSDGGYEEQEHRLDVGVGYVSGGIKLYGDVCMGYGIPAEIRVGGEIKPVSIMAVRVGGEQRSLGGGKSYFNGTAGIGVEINNFALDYGYVYSGLISGSSSHFVSLSLGW